MEKQTQPKKRREPPSPLQNERHPTHQNEKIKRVRRSLIEEKSWEKGLHDLINEQGLNEDQLEESPPKESLEGQIQINEDDLTYCEPSQRISLEGEEEEEEDEEEEEKSTGFVNKEIFQNALFKIVTLQRNVTQQRNGLVSVNLYVELSPSPPVDVFGRPMEEPQPEVLYPISTSNRQLLYLYVQGSWAKHFFAEEGDLVRVIGTFCPENNYTLMLDENLQGDLVDYPQDINKAKMIIVEPFIMIATTQICKTISCTRSAFIGNIFRIDSESYPKVIGNIVHEIFQKILEASNYSNEAVDKFISDCIQKELMSLYYLKKTVEEVYRDAKEAVGKIIQWVNCVSHGNVFYCQSNVGSRNQHGIKYNGFIASEQEFNTALYGIKAYVDVTVSLSDKHSKELVTALEIKTGRKKPIDYIGQVILYSLLLQERFQNSNPRNILLYIRDENPKVEPAFQYIRQKWLELNALIQNRNALAKYQKLHSVNEAQKNLFFCSQEQLVPPPTIAIPPMITQVGECERCYSSKLCTLTSLAFEEQRNEGQGNFQTFKELEGKINQEVKEYFRKFIECINLEQNEDIGFKKKQAAFDAELDLVYIFHHNESLEVILRRRLQVSEKDTPLREKSSVTLTTCDNISFYMGQISEKSIVSLPVASKREHSGLPKPEISSSRESSIDPEDLEFLDYVEYRVAFRRHLKTNLSKECFGGRDPYQLKWTLATEQPSTFVYQLMRGNIYSLCMVKEELLNYILYGKEPILPREKEVIDFYKDFSHQLSPLSPSQQLAVAHACLTSPYYLIQGCASSGKQTLLLALLSVLKLLGKSILLTASSDHALDLLLTKLIAANVHFTRIANSLNQVSIKEVQERAVTSDQFKSMDEIRQCVDKCSIFAATSNQMQNMLLQSIRFDVCVLADAANLIEPLALGPLFLAGQFIMVGDYEAARPSLKSKLADRKGLGVSLFERLSKNNANNVAYLRQQYRMTGEVMDLCNKVVYLEKPMQGHSKVVNQKLEFPVKTHEPVPWIRFVREKTISLISTDHLEEFENKMLQNQAEKNYLEAAIIQCITCSFLSSGISDIGVVAPTSEQASLIKSGIGKLSKDIVIQPFERLFGLKSKVLIISLTKHSKKHAIIRELKKIREVVSKATLKLILVGSLRSAGTVAEVKMLIDIIREKGGMVELKSLDKEIQKFYNYEGE